MRSRKATQERPLCTFDDKIKITAEDIPCFCSTMRLAPLFRKGPNICAIILNSCNSISQGFSSNPHSRGGAFLLHEKFLLVLSDDFFTLGFPFLAILHCIAEIFITKNSKDTTVFALVCKRNAVERKR